MAVIGEPRLNTVHDSQFVGLSGPRCSASGVRESFYRYDGISGTRGDTGELVRERAMSSSWNRVGLDPGELSDPEDAYVDIDPHRYELHNIQSVIKVTRQNIDALNNRFAGFQHPPSIYLTEYHELTSKLHELESKEQKLIELRNASGVGSQEDCNASAVYRCPRTPSKSLLRAHLPNQQRTSVQVRRIQEESFVLLVDTVLRVTFGLKSDDRFYVLVFFGSHWGIA